MIRTLLLGWLALLPVAAQAQSGKDLYAKQCARCHGANGEGTKRYEAPLVGDRSVKQLAKYVQETMPENNPGSLSAAEAEAVSAYLHDAFYSPIAQDRLRPARVQLSRLTVRQYRHAVADLVQSFRATPKWDEQRGLKGEYFNARGPGQKKAHERIDPVVSFDWGKEVPVAEKLTDPYVFSAAWNGSFLAPETGTYEFAVRTEHATRLYVNDARKPLIDAWVKSGNDTEFRASIYLVGGRIYPIKLEFSKANQGVDDPKRQKEKPVTPASIALLWKPPHGVLEVMPSRALSPNAAPEQFVCATPFPPDDRSLGWERGTSVSKEWDAATTDAALEAAAYVAARIDDLTKASRRAPADAARLVEFAHAFTERAYRRPLTADQKAVIARQFEGAKDPEAALKTAVLLALKSPRFLYREFGTEKDAFAVAGRLAFGLWDSLPDDALLQAAKDGQLATPEQVRRQASRMLADPRAQAKLKGFFDHWLLVEHAGELAKDPKKFPGFDAALVADLRTSLDLFLADVGYGPKSDFRKLFTSGEIYLTGKLAGFYGAAVPAGDGFTKVRLDDGQRAGLLTHPFLMASFAYAAESSPIHRGVFLTRGVLGLSLKPPPEAVNPAPPDLHPNLNTRERVALQTKAPTCMTCHSLINDLGFTLERFDAVGRFREKDNARPVDSTGTYLTREGKQVAFGGAVDLGKFLAESREVHDAFAEQVFHHVAQQPILAYGPETRAKLVAAFAKADYNVRDLFVEAAAVLAAGPPARK